jgi:hypothetical protein
MKPLSVNFLHNHPTLEAKIHNIDPAILSNGHVIVDRTDWLKALGLLGLPIPSPRRFCKGCQADVTSSMYCYCGEFHLLESETLSEAELQKLSIVT